MVSDSQGQPRKIVLADYFLGFSTRSVSGGARPWQLYYEPQDRPAASPPKCKAAFSGDLYVTGDIKDIASTYYPVIGPYDTTDPHVAEYHVLLAKAAGIDGFMAEFTIGQEDNLLCLVEAARKYNFQIGINWINQSHLAENTWPDRPSAMNKAKDVIRWMAEHVYKSCGVRVDGRFLLLIFLAHPRQPAQPLDPFFSPEEVAVLKEAAADAGFDANFLVIPWEKLPEAAAQPPAAARVWDGYFPWIWMSPGAPIPAGTGWTLATSRENYLQRLRDYYADSARVKKDGRIGTYIGAVCPGFDDHRGQAWGEAHKRHLPRDNGLTLQQTWELLKQSGVNTALIITWNDWVESSQIEPSLEVDSDDLRECRRQIADWKQTQIDEQLLALPLTLLRARRTLEFLSHCAISRAEEDKSRQLLDQAAESIASFSVSDAAQRLDLASAQLNLCKSGLQQRNINVFWEYGFDSIGIERVTAANAEPISADDFSGIKHSGGAIGFAITDSTRHALHQGCFIGRLCLEYLDVGVDFLKVVVDAVDKKHQTIAIFKKTNTGKWMKASLDLVNARFVKGLAGSADMQIEQWPNSSGGVRMLRIDGILYSV